MEMDAVTLEHRLTLIEEQMRAGFDTLQAEAKTTIIEMAGMKNELRTNTEKVAALEAQVGRQNGRVRMVEDWIADRKLQLARAAGVVEGRTGLTRTQLAVLGVLMPASFAVLDLGLRLLVAIT